jgi:molecular chaperone GrpE
LAKEKEPQEKNDEKIEQEENAEAAPSKIQKEEQNYEELREQMLRLAAEFDNYKKKAKKDVEISEKLGKAALIKNLLPIVDEFELSMLALNDSKDNSISKGIEMLYSNLMNVLKKEGLKEIETGGIFDPYKHEIIMVRESDKKDGTILEIVKKGYLFGDKLLRPAAVIIAKHADEQKEKTEKNDGKTEQK